MDSFLSGDGLDDFFDVLDLVFDLYLLFDLFLAERTLLFFSGLMLYDGDKLGSSFRMCCKIC